MERTPGKISGAWAFTGTRVPVYALFENLESGATVTVFLERYPGIEEWQGDSRPGRSGMPQDSQSAVNIPFGHRTPALRRRLGEHTVDRSAEHGWAFFGNGELIGRAEEGGYQVVVTTDQKMGHHQHYVGRRLGLVVLIATAWPQFQLRVEKIRWAMDEMPPGHVQEVSVPRQVSVG